MLCTWLACAEQGPCSLGPNKQLVRPLEGSDLAIVLHGTPVVTFHRNGTVTLFAGGHLTKTTVRTMNEHLPRGNRVWSERGTMMFGNEEKSFVALAFSPDKPATVRPVR